MLVVDIHQLHFMPQAVLGIFMVGEHKVKDSNSIDSFKIKIPNAFLALILNRKGGIEHASVLEKLLLSLLHLNDERLALLVLAVDIEDGTAVAIAITQILTIKVSKIPHYFLAIEE